MLRDWTDSLKFDGLTVEAERLFIRLIMKADDYGRFHADPRLIRGTCFPLFDNLRTEHVGRWLDELHHRNLIFRYEADGQKLLALVNFGQRLKQSRWKFPPAPGESGEWLPTSGNFREVAGSEPPERKGIENEVERNLKARAGSQEMISEFCKSIGLAASDAEYLWHKWEANGWKNGKEKIRDWKKTIQSWKAGGFLPSQKNGSSPARKQESFL